MAVLSEEEARRALVDARARGGDLRLALDQWKISLYGYAAPNLEYALFPLPPDHPKIPPAERGQIEMF